LTGIQGATDHELYQTAENWILLVTLCYLRKVGPWHISQHVKFQGIHRSSVGRIIHDLFRATHPEENNGPIQLLMYIATLLR